MARRLPARESLVKLIVGAGQASPSPPVGPALGSKGVKSIDFCKVHRSPSYLPRPYCPPSPLPLSLTQPGIQRPNSTHKPRHAHPLPHNRPPGPQLLLHAPHAAHSNTTPDSRRRRRLKGRETTRRQRAWACACPAHNTDAGTITLPGSRWGSNAAYATG